MKERLQKFILRLIGPKFVTVGTPVIIQNSKGEILLGKRSENNPIYSGYWGLPGGIMDYGETPEETAKREVREEMGVEIKIKKRSKSIYNVLPEKNQLIKIHSINIPFYCKIISGEPKPEDETDKVKWFKPKEIKEMNLAYTHNDILKKEGLLK